jgi:endo-1,4-beta-D-glucanase Y
MNKIFCLIALIIPLSLWAAPKFPFPQNAKYPFGIKPSAINSDSIQFVYDKLLKGFYEESGDKARIKWDSPGQTVSEGIGYGMLIMVYMDNVKNNTQAKFDKLWKYYNSFLNKNGLMNWKVDGFSNVSGQNAATDAEMDVAMALIQAYKQWGDDKYLNDAKALIQKVWDFEVNANKFLKPGDSWDTKKNPSYFSTAALQVFKHASTQDWDKVITNSYSLIKKCANSNTGLVPDWCGEDGSALGSYGYDAARTPWRIAWGYVWYGHDAAKEICSKMATWINTKTSGNAESVVDGYGLEGNNSGANLNSTFLGAFACAGMVDATHQSWLNDAYSKQVSLVSKDESYYNTTLKVIYLLLLSGNMPDFWTPVVSNLVHEQTCSQSSLINSASFNSDKSVMISVSHAGTVNLVIYDIAGKQVAKIADHYCNKGISKVQFQKQLNSGTYFLMLESVTGTVVQKLTVFNL